MSDRPKPPPSGAAPQTAQFFVPTGSSARGYVAGGTGGVSKKPEPQPVAPAPAPAPPASAAGAAERGRVLAETVVGSMIDRMIAEARMRGGYLAVADIEALREDMTAKTQALEKVFERSLEEYVVARERANWDQARRFPFDRMLVKTFAHLFPGPGGMPLRAGGLPRRVLPGVFMAVNKMLGEEAVEGLQVKARRIVADFRNDQDAPVDWEAVHRAPATRALLVKAMMAMAPYFEDAAKRRHWFVDLVNGHLAPIDDDSKESREAAEWQMTEASFLNLANALFQPLVRALADPAMRAKLEQTHGKNACASATKAIASLAALGRA